MAGRVVGATAGAATTAVGVAGAAVSTTASVAGSAASGAAGLTSAAVSGASSAAAAGTATTAASSSAVSPAVVGGATGFVLAAAYDQDSRSIDSAAQSEGVGNCLRANGNAASADRLLTAAGWEDGGMDGPNRVFLKNSVRGLVLPDGACVFRSENTLAYNADVAVRGVVSSLYPGALVEGTPSGARGPCDGFTLPNARTAWVHYTNVNGGTCERGLGSGVTVQFL
ncbi:MAG: hypothetical protein AAGF79_10630 [Pseudomonadota bacterium]